MPLLTSLLVLIVCARLLGQLFHRFRQPVIVGEMLAGVLLGPSVFNLVQASAALSGIAELAVFLIVLSAGLEMNFKDVTGVLRGRGLVLAVLGFALPLVAGLVTGLAYGLDTTRAIIMGLCISITALPVAIRILQSFKLLNSDIARYSVATAIFNDVAALLALGVIFQLPAEPTLPVLLSSILAASGKLLVLVVSVIGANWFLQRLVAQGWQIQKFPEKVVELFGNEGLFGVLVLFVLTFGSLSEVMGYHFVIGAFFGALLIDSKFFLTPRYDELDRTVRSITSGFLGPVFFAYLGLKFEIMSLRPWDMVVVVLAVSIITKLLAGWWGGRFLGMSKVGALGLGIILNGRGVMELVVASIAYERGFIGPSLFSLLVLMGVFTTMITPILFRKLVMPHL